MSATPDWLQERIRTYYNETTEKNYLPHWCGPSLALHLGLHAEGATTLEQYHVNTNAELAERACIGADTAVLDAGCGVGGTSLWLAQERGARVLGITLEPRQCELASGFAVERGLAERARFEVRDFAETGLPPASFDVIVHVESLSHAHDLAAYFAHAATLLRPGGRFACFDYFLGDGGDGAAARAMCEGWVLPDLKSLDEAAATLAAAGFVDVKAVDRTASALIPARALERVGMMGLMMLERQKAAGEEEAPMRRGNALGAIGAARGLATGSVRYGWLQGTSP
jgi:tocopherol O-methyltransferase